MVRLKYLTVLKNQILEKVKEDPSTDLVKLREDLIKEITYIINAAYISKDNKV